MPQFPHSGATNHYETLGEGAPLLLIAGTASDNASWGPLLPLLPGRQLIMPDNRGSGRTECEGQFEIDDIVEDSAALLDHLGIAEIDVVGHSLGGMIGLRLAARYPHKVRCRGTGGRRRRHHAAGLWRRGADREGRRYRPCPRPPGRAKA